MTADRGTVLLEPGQTVVVSGPAPLASHANSGHTRVRVTAPGVYVPPPPLWTPPAGAAVILPGVNMAGQLSAGARLFFLRTGTHKLSLGSTLTKYRDVSIIAYPGDSPVIDGTGLDPHLVYLDTDSGTWTLEDIAFQGFYPRDSGVIGVGDGCRLVMRRVRMTGMGRAGLPYDSGSHALYFHGSGTGLLEDVDARGFPGAALHLYRGTPKVIVNRGHFGAFYESILVGSGDVTLNQVEMVEPLAAWDLQVYTAEGPAKVTLNGCSGTGPNGTVRRVG